MKSRRGVRLPTGIVVGAVALGPGDAGGEGRGHELLRLAGAEVVERPHPDHAEPVAEERLEGQGVGRHLARPRRGWPAAGGASSSSGQLARPTRRRRRRRWPRTAPGATPACRQASSTLSVPSALRREGARRVAPRRADVGPAGQVVHGVGAGVGDRPPARRAASVMSTGCGAVVVERRRPRRRSREVLDEVAPDEAEPARHERAHRPRWSGAWTSGGRA